ncbi:PAS domain-containing sensor histidine kinase [Flavihumibacter sp. UBA7668]|uniref:PAS domain-containing sensor histidine kinase n=1 Tax=Flavihumibacter sp. UBA7668 TaxID=1946542 RepID=UPI0025C5C407|nr:PAS domain S-box protein [Flavihumibacter sp. UBA7668]
MQQTETGIIQEYERIMDASLDIICTMNQDGMFTRVSRAATRILGYSLEEMLGKPYLSFIEDADQLSSVTMLARAISGQPVNHFDNRVRCKNGNLAIIRWSANWNEAAQLLYCVGRDATEKIKIEARIEESEHRYRNLFHNNPLPMWIIDLESKQFLEVNEKAISHYGYSREEFLDMTAFSIRPEEDRGLMHHLDRVKEGANLVHKRRWRHLKKNGELIDVDITSHQIEYNGKPAALVLSHDISERVRLEKLKIEEERNREALINSTSDMIWSIDSSYRLLAANRSFIDTTALTSGVSIRKGENMLLEAAYPEEHIQYWKVLYDRALTGEAFHMQSMDIYTKPGQEIWWETSFNPIYEGDQVVGVACHARDITMNRSYQSELWQLNQKLETAQKLAKLGYWELNLETKELFWTMEVFSIWGRHPSNFQPGFEQFMGTVHPDDREEFLTRRARVLNGEEELDFQHRILLPDGSIRFVHEKGSLFKDQLGNVVRYSGTVQDITQRKLYEQALEQANSELSERAEQLARSNAELERFAFVASHDLQEPLRMVSSFLQLLDKRYREKIDDAGRQYINFAVGGAERMKKLINDLLEYSRIEHALGNLDVVDMMQVVKEVCLNLQEAIADNEAKIKFEKLPVLQKGNYSGMVQLLQNLIGNALKYRSEAPVSIQISCKEEADQWLFSVKDNGIGIESDYFEKIFIIFQRLHNMSEYSGTGIGLAICKKIVEQHGGKIWVYSIENQGSTFYFTIKK